MEPITLSIFELVLIIKSRSNELTQLTKDVENEKVLQNFGIDGYTKAKEQAKKCLRSIVEATSILDTKLSIGERMNHE